METWITLGGYLAALMLVVSGLVVMGMGQAFAALREIALNTREAARAANPAAEQARTSYRGLTLIALALGVVGGFEIAAGVLTALGLAVQHLTASSPAPYVRPAPPRFDQRGYPIPPSNP